MSEFATDTFNRTKAWCQQVDKTKRAAGIEDLQEIAANILPKVVNKVTWNEQMDRSRMMTVSWAAGLYLQAKDAEKMQLIDANDWIADSYPDDIQRHFKENLQKFTEDDRRHVQEDFKQDFTDESNFSENDNLQAVDLFFRVVAYYEAVEAVYAEYIEAVEAA